MLTLDEKENKFSLHLDNRCILQFNINMWTWTSKISHYLQVLMCKLHVLSKYLWYGHVVEGMFSALYESLWIFNRVYKVNKHAACQQCVWNLSLYMYILVHNFVLVWYIFVYFSVLCLCTHIISISLVFY